MTENQWMTSGEPEPMLAFLGRAYSPRKLRLFAAACARQLLDQNRCAELAYATLETAEDHADSSPGHFPTAYRDYNESLYRELRAAAPNARDRFNPRGPEAIVGAALNPTPLDAAIAAGRMLVLELGGRITSVTTDKVRRPVVQSKEGDRAPWVEGPAGPLAAGLLREIAGNPFRRVAVDPAWRTSTVVAISQGIYQARDFAALPILADALQDAGCDNAELLNHCRKVGKHVRGCWLLDLLLGKK